LPTQPTKLTTRSNRSGLFATLIGIYTTKSLLLLQKKNKNQNVMDSFSKQKHRMKKTADK
jgi:hypothetical protein